MRQTLHRRAQRLKTALASPKVKVHLIHIARQMTVADVPLFSDRVASLAADVKSEGPVMKVVLVMPCEDAPTPVAKASSSELMDVWIIPCVPLSLLTAQKAPRKVTLLDADIKDSRVPWNELARAFAAEYPHVRRN
jgi:hypothetical protein